MVVVGVVLILGAGGALFARLLAREYAERLVAHGRQLEEANKELDSFTYSVSHDLRGPLRAIDGFSRILLEDHAKELDDEARRALGVIRTNAQRMGQLIDDLLAFSRLSRQRIQVRPLDMEQLVRAVITEVSSFEPQRAIEFRVGPLPSAPGDPALLKQVWLNLLGNAVKYTRRHAQAVIDVAGAVQGGEIVYTVTDNGVGFDMQYVGKLFGVFQRLHAAPEFEGTGVGLALVQRIVQRHGGRVWAEGKPDQGAVFAFAIPREGR